MLQSQAYQASIAETGTNFAAADADKPVFALVSPSSHIKAVSGEDNTSARSFLLSAFLPSGLDLKGI
jgi:hypothetical protein